MEKGTLTIQKIFIMKKRTIFFAFITSLLIFTLFSCNKAPKELENISFTGSGNYGVTSDGIFFVHKDIVAGFDDISLVVLPKKTIYNDSVVYETGEKKVYKMIKAGDYFLSKPDKAPTKTFYYFKSDIICLPTFGTEKFNTNDLIKNQCEGYLLKSF